MTDNFEVNRDRLFTDLYFMRKMLLSSTSPDLIKYDLDGFIVLNEVFKDLTGLELELNTFYQTHPDAYTIYNRTIDKNISKLYTYIYDNDKLLLNSFGRVSKILTDCEFVGFAYNDTIKNYSKKDFKDIILEFYSSIDEDYYKIARKYFDYKKIQTGYDTTYQEFAAFFSCIVSLKTGYVISTSNFYNSSSAAYLVHELGHAIDAETFLFPQQKTISLHCDPLLEVPSRALETCFLDFLVKKKIDITGALLLDNYMISEIDSYGEDLKDVFQTPDAGIDKNGLALDKNNQIINFKDAYLYGTADLFALNMREIYRKDPKEFKKILYNVISSRKECTLEESIQKLGISVDDFAEGKYIESSIKENNMLLKKRFNYYSSN